MMESLNNAFHFDTLVWHWPIAIYLFVLGSSRYRCRLPLTLKVVCSDNTQQTKAFVVILPVFTLVGVMSLRMFILYAGQMVVA